MKQEFKAHPLMILSLIKPFLFVLILPVLKGAVQYLIYRRITGVFTLEAAALIVMLLAAFLRFRSFSIVCGKNGVKIREGVFLKKPLISPFQSCPRFKRCKIRWTRFSAPLPTALIPRQAKRAKPILSLS